jgi:multidrug resistance efflux pump
MIAMVVGFLTSRLAGPIFGAAALGLLGVLIWSGVQNVRLNSTITQLDDEIHNPNTGYIAKVDRLTANVSTLEGNQRTLQASINEQNAAVTALKAAADKQQADYQAAVVRGAQATRQAQQLSLQVMTLRTMPAATATAAPSMPQTATLARQSIDALVRGLP